MSEHAVLAPSSAPIWGYCSGSVRAQAGRPDKPSQDQRDGDAAHWVVAECLNAYKSGQEGARLLCSDWVDDVDPAGTVITHEHAEGAQVMVTDVLKTVQQLGASVRDLMIEFRVSMPRIHEQNGGTFDCAIIIPKLFLIILWDYKNGHAERVAREDFQMIDYAEGLVELLGLTGLDDQVWTIDFRIVQPFCYRGNGPVSRWEVKLSDLRAHFNWLSQQAHEALSASPTLTPGKHCRYCKAVLDCPATRRGVYDLIDFARTPYEMEVMSPEDRVAERKILRDGLKVIEARLETLEDLHVAELKAGKGGGGLTFENSYGREKWAVADSVAIAMAAQFGVDISKGAAVTPKQARAKAPPAMAEAFETAMKSISHTPTNGYKLVAVEDSKTAAAFKPKT